MEEEQVVHLDEANPHIHCSVIPVTPRNSISWKYWFVGNGVYDAQKIWAKMHSDLAKINAKYGMERGESIHETGAKHISTEKYRRTAAGLAHEKEATLNMSNEANSILSDQLSKLLPTLSVPQLQTLFCSDSQLFDADSIETLATKTNEVIACAALLYSGFINEATTYAVSHGGA